MPTELRSYAKVNLGLRIGRVRADGFHSLATVYQMIDLWDRVTVSAVLAAATEITIRCDDPRVPCDARNTCWKMVEAALAALGVQAQVEIAIDKRLPVQGGLGAGSGNAAAALLGLERELAGQVRVLDPAERLAIAARVGSDVPLFLLGGTVWGRGRGEEVSALADSDPLACVVAVPECAVSTPRAFRDWDLATQMSLRDDSFQRLKPNEIGGGIGTVETVPCFDTPPRGSTLTGDGEFATLNELNRAVAEVWRLDGSSGVFSLGRGLAENSLLSLVQTGIVNDFESVVFPQQPRLRDLKLALAGSPATSQENQALYAALSGSGAALFGLYGSAAAAEEAAARVRALDCVALLTQTLPRAAMDLGALDNERCE